MKLLKGIEAIDLGLYVDKALIITDVHIGYEEALNKQGILVPRFQFPDLIKRMQGIFERLRNKKIETVIINGDLKHEFGTISQQEWRHTIRFLDFIGNYCKNILLIKGNHDTILGPIANKRNVRLVENVELGKVLVCHGNRIPKIPNIKKFDTIIIGHEHPAISLRDGSRVETYKCYLVGKYKRKNLIAQPSFNLVSEGTDILKEKLLSPFLQHNLDNFHIYAIENKLYNLGIKRNIN